MKHFCSYSEAIREGAKLRPQAFDKLLHAGGTCAIGAGFDAMAVNLPEFAGTDYERTRSREIFLELYTYILEVRTVQCPQCGCGCVHLHDAILHLNDEHKWPREAIADWLEREEEKFGFITLIESECSSKSLQRAVLSV